MLKRLNEVLADRQSDKDILEEFHREYKVFIATKSSFEGGHLLSPERLSSCLRFIGVVQTFIPCSGLFVDLNDKSIEKWYDITDLCIKHLMTKCDPRNSLQYKFDNIDKCGLIDGCLTEHGLALMRRVLNYNQVL